MKSFLILAATAAALTAEPVKIQLPAPPPAIAPGPGSELLLGHCMICHSAEYFTTQPPLGAEKWRAIVDKMRVTFGSPLPEDQVDAVVAYLAKNYGPEEKSAPAQPAAK